MYFVSSSPIKELTSLRVAKITDQGIIPSRASIKAAGYDLHSAYDYEIPAMGKCICKTDIQIALPEGCYGRIAPRSGLAANNFIDIGGGVIDADYRGNLCVIVFNFGTNIFIINRGDRIAQLICERIYTPDIVCCESLNETKRGDGAFGSTGC